MYRRMAVLDLLFTHRSSCTSRPIDELKTCRRLVRIIVTSCCVLAAVIFPSNIDAFNIDTKVPIVKMGTTDSYFGYSIAQHLVYNRARGFGDAMVLVGAPRDNITDPSASRLVQSIVRPGLVYRCPYTSLTDDCTSLKIDREDPQGDVDKNNQWMGASVASQATDHGKAVACAHRYKKSGSSFTWGLGICVSMTNALDEDDFWEPCDGKPKDKGHGEYGFCQAGISSAFSQDGDLVLGAPGAYNWRGVVFKNSVENSLSDEKQWFQNVVEDPIPPATLPTPSTGYYAYLGMSVKVGMILEGKKTYVSGAPRSGDTGQVLMFQLGSNGVLKLDKQHYLSGDQFGSGFGFDIAIADFNSDGKEDLAVGAPFYHEPGVGGAIYIYMNGPDGINKDTVPLKIMSRKLTVHNCTELLCHNARFGFSLANIGDIDHDGYQDLAVGAPFESQGVDSRFEGNGAVYIFRGSAGGILKDPSQRIHATDLPSARPLNTFGYSLSGGIDMDNNGYPDVTVGAFQSDKIIMLRSRPVINVVSTFVANPSKINPKITECMKESEKSRTKKNCFELSLCFRFTAKPKERFRGPIDIDYSLDAEKFARAKVVRVIFKGTRPNEGHVINRTVTLQEQSIEQCRSHIVYIIENNRDFLTPIQFQLTYKLKDVLPPTMRPGEPIPDINSYPVLNDAKAVVPLAVNFVKNCRRDTECISNLEVKEVKVIFCRRDTDCVDSSQDVKDFSDEYTLRVGLDDEVRLRIHITNVDQEEAHDTMLNITLPESLEYRGTDDRGKIYNCQPIGRFVICSIGNPLPKNHEVVFAIKLDPSKVLPTLEKLKIIVQVNTTSRELSLSDDVKVIQLAVVVQTDLEVKGASSPSSVYYSGEVRGESDIRTEDQIGSEVIHTYVVSNLGGGRVANSTLLISWPYEKEIGYTQGKHLLYLMDDPEETGPGSCVVKPHMVNPNNITRIIPKIDWSKPTLKPGEAPERTRRSTDYEDNGENDHQEEMEDGKVSLDCDNKMSTKCHKIECHIGELLPGRTFIVKLRSRLWNSTFLEDYTDVEMVRISSSARIVIDPILFIRQTNTHNDFDKATTIALPGIQVIGSPQVPLWVIIVALLAGLFLLFLIIFLLWHCGFFKRTKPDEMAIHKAKLENHKPYSDYD